MTTNTNPSQQPAPATPHSPTPRLMNPDLADTREELRERLARLNGVPYAPPPPNAPNKPYPRTATCARLDAAVIEPPPWAITGLLPQGAAILAGKPKAGKSWLALDLALAITTGRPAAGELTPVIGDVLYLALEDSAERLQTRQRAARGGIPAPQSLHFGNHWPRFPQGLLALDLWLEDHPRTRLVILDTLAKVRSPRPTSSSAYAEDYETLGAIKRIADRRRTTILVVHHLRKAAIDDPLDAVSGSAGLTGAADTILVLTRRRGAPAARLFATGRDLDDTELTLTWQTTPARWRITAEGEAPLTPTFTEIINTLAGHPDGLSPAELAEASGRSGGATRVALHEMAQRNLVTRENGRYRPASAALPHTASGARGDDTADQSEVPVPPDRTASSLERELTDAALSSSAPWPEDHAA